MRHWIETQPDGQGLLSDFELHFKSLSDADKEVRLTTKCRRIPLTTPHSLSPSREKCDSFKPRQYVPASAPHHSHSQPHQRKIKAATKKATNNTPTE